MNWNKDTDFKVVFTDNAKKQFVNIIDYLFFELNNAQAAYNVEQDMKETAQTLSHVADSLKLCDNPKLNSRGYRTIHFRRHRYFMLYKIIDNIARVDGVYHDLQDYESFFQ